MYMEGRRVCALLIMLRELVGARDGWWVGDEWGSKATQFLHHKVVSNSLAMGLNAQLEVCWIGFSTRCNS